MFESWKQELIRKHFSGEYRGRGSTTREAPANRSASPVYLAAPGEKSKKEENIKNESSFLEEDGFESGTSKPLDCGRNVCSLILLCQRSFFYQAPLWGKKAGGGAMWKVVWDWVAARAKLRSLKWWGHSSVANQVRFDFIFESADAASSFHSEVRNCWHDLDLPTAVNRRSFLFSEEEFGFMQEPVLWEADLLSMTSQAQQLFRFFINCEAFEEGGKIAVKFNNLSDLNLFLYNKVKFADQRTLGTLRKRTASKRLVSDSFGQFRLFSEDLEKRNPLVPIGSLVPEVKFEVKESETEGGERKKGAFLCFATKLDLFKFFTSEDAKTIEYLDIDSSLIEDIETDKEAESSSWGVEVEKEFLKNIENFNSYHFSQKIVHDLMVAEKTMRESELSRVMERAAQLPTTSTLTLKQVLSLEFLGEQDKGHKDFKKPYPVLLANFLTSPFLLGVEEADEDVIFRCVEEGELKKALLELATNSSVRGLADGARQRASLVLDPIIDGYEVLIELEEKGLLMSTISEVEEKLNKLSSEVVPRPSGFSVLFPSLISLLETLLISRTLFQHHSAKISRRNMLFYSASRTSFCNSPCLTESELMCLAERSNGEKRVVESLTKILSRLTLPCQEDWDGRLVVVFKDEDELEKLLSRFGSSRVDLEGRTPGHKLQAFNQVYSIDCHLNIPNKIRKVDVRDFFPHDTGCKFDGTQKISSTSCCFLGRVLSDPSLRSAYPLMQIASENVHVLE